MFDPNLNKNEIQLWLNVLVEEQNILANTNLFSKSIPCTITINPIQTNPINMNLIQNNPINPFNTNLIQNDPINPINPNLIYNNPLTDPNLIQNNPLTDTEPNLNTLLNTLSVDELINICQPDMNQIRCKPSNRSKLSTLSKLCANCNCILYNPVRRINDMRVCNACGLYYKRTQKHRPFRTFKLQTYSAHL